jgi:hypothetical protein
MTAVVFYDMWQNGFRQPNSSKVIDIQHPITCVNTSFGIQKALL